MVLVLKVVLVYNVHNYFSTNFIVEFGISKLYDVGFQSLIYCVIGFDKLELCDASFEGSTPFDVDF